LPVQSVTVPVSLRDWLARLPDPRDRRGVRFTLVLQSLFHVVC
jgi:hypothetical protein